MSSKYIVPIGVLVAAILIIVGGYTMLNLQSSGSSDTQNSDLYVEPAEIVYEPFTIPKINVTEGVLKQNADVPFKVGDKYKYKTITQHIYRYVECKDEVSQKEYNRRMEEYYKKIEEEKINITEPELPAGCEQKNKTTPTTIVVEYNVERIERVEGKECYVVSAKEERDLEELKRKMRENMPTASEKEIEIEARQFKKAIEQQGIYYYDKETGRIIKVVTKRGDMEMTFTMDYCNVIESLGGAVGGALPPLSRWMLALDENFRWTQTIETEDPKGKSITEIEYKVIGTEKVNNRECFKVEMTIKDKSKELEEHLPIISKYIVWVDKEKRILIKAQTNIENFFTIETNLISEI